jgi:hypothetical protein
MYYVCRFTDRAGSFFTLTETAPTNSPPPGVRAVRLVAVLGSLAEAGQLVSDLEDHRLACRAGRVSSRSCTSSGTARPYVADRGPVAQR